MKFLKLLAADFLRWIRFLLFLGHAPKTYRKLFRDISTCYLTAQAPGVAQISGFNTTCTTNCKYMILTIDGAAIFYVDRENLIVRVPTLDEEISIWDRRIRPLRLVFEAMIINGVPYAMSDVSQKYAPSDVHIITPPPDEEEKEKVNVEE